MQCLIVKKPSEQDPAHEIPGDSADEDGADQPHWR